MIISKIKREPTNSFVQLGFWNEKTDASLANKAVDVVKFSGKRRLLNYNDESKIIEELEIREIVHWKQITQGLAIIYYPENTSNLILLIIDNDVFKETKILIDDSTKKQTLVAFHADILEDNQKNLFISVDFIHPDNHEAAIKERTFNFMFWKSQPEQIPLKVTTKVYHIDFKDRNPKSDVIYSEAVTLEKQSVWFLRFLENFNVGLFFKNQTTQAEVVLSPYCEFFLQEDKKYNWKLIEKSAFFDFNTNGLYFKINRSSNILTAKKQGVSGIYVTQLSPTPNEHSIFTVLPLQNFSQETEDINYFTLVERTEDRLSFTSMSTLGTTKTAPLTFNSLDIKEIDDAAFQQQLQGNYEDLFEKEYFEEIQSEWGEPIMIYRSEASAQYVIVYIFKRLTYNELEDENVLLFTSPNPNKTELYNIILFEFSAALTNSYFKVYNTPNIKLGDGQMVLVATSYNHDENRISLFFRNKPSAFYCSRDTMTHIGDQPLNTFTSLKTSLIDNISSIQTALNTINSSMAEVGAYFSKSGEVSKGKEQQFQDMVSAMFATKKKEDEKYRYNQLFEFPAGADNILGLYSDKLYKWVLYGTGELCGYESKKEVQSEVFRFNLNSFNLGNDTPFLLRVFIEGDLIAVVFNIFTIWLLKCGVILCQETHSTTLSTSYFDSNNPYMFQYQGNTTTFVQRLSRKGPGTVFIKCVQFCKNVDFIDPVVENFYLDVFSNLINSESLLQWQKRECIAQNRFLVNSVNQELAWVIDADMGRVFGFLDSLTQISVRTVSTIKKKSTPSIYDLHGEYNKSALDFISKPRDKILLNSTFYQNLNDFVFKWKTNVLEKPFQRLVNNYLLEENFKLVTSTYDNNNQRFQRTALTKDVNYNMWITEKFKENDSSYQPLPFIKTQPLLNFSIESLSNAFSACVVSYKLNYLSLGLVSAVGFKDYAITEKDAPKQERVFVKKTIANNLNQSLIYKLEKEEGGGIKILGKSFWEKDFITLTLTTNYQGTDYKYALKIKTGKKIAKKSIFCFDSCGNLFAFSENKIYCASIISTPSFKRYAILGLDTALINTTHVIRSIKFSDSNKKPGYYILMETGQHFDHLIYQYTETEGEEPTFVQVFEYQTWLPPEYVSFLNGDPSHLIISEFENRKSPKILNCLTRNFENGFNKTTGLYLTDMQFCFTFSLGSEIKNIEGQVWENLTDVYFQLQDLSFYFKKTPGESIKAVHYNSKYKILNFCTQILKKEDNFAISLYSMSYSESEKNYVIRSQNFLILNHKLPTEYTIYHFELIQGDNIIFNDPYLSSAGKDKRTMFANLLNPISTIFNYKPGDTVHFDPNSRKFEKLEFLETYDEEANAIKTLQNLEVPLSSEIFRRDFSSIKPSGVSDLKNDGTEKLFVFKNKLHKLTTQKKQTLCILSEVNSNLLVCFTESQEKKVKVAIHIFRTVAIEQNNLLINFNSDSCPFLRFQSLSEGKRFFVYFESLKDSEFKYQLGDIPKNNEVTTTDDKFIKLKLPKTSLTEGEYVFQGCIELNQLLFVFKCSVKLMFLAFEDPTPKAYYVDINKYYSNAKVTKIVVTGTGFILIFSTGVMLSFLVDRSNQQISLRNHPLYLQENDGSLVEADYTISKMQKWSQTCFFNGQINKAEYN